MRTIIQRAIRRPIIGDGSRCASTLAAAMLLSCGTMLVLASRDNAHLADESLRIALGYTHLAYGNLKLNLEDPPLGKELAAVPLLFMDLRLPRDLSSLVKLNLVALYPFFMLLTAMWIFVDPRHDAMRLIRRVAHVFLLSIVLIVLYYQVHFFFWPVEDQAKEIGALVAETTHASYAP